MSGFAREERQRLANGLTLCLRHDPGATEAAALLRVAAGSDAEPPDRPGLAHLLEHLLFAGGRAYPREQRLMSWIPAQGGDALTPPPAAKVPPTSLPLSRPNWRRAWRA
ncbi:insulinase family protein [Acerihabitans sp. KWT182]|uniref:Insulinase family protein n=1 Tax=Acerihabitans sp. KWT182 TaxID=3157919 RepID=A0AAU7QEY0_9GAMM